MEKKSEEFYNMRFTMLTYIIFKIFPTIYSIVENKKIESEEVLKIIEKDNNSKNLIIDQIKYLLDLMLQEEIEFLYEMKNDKNQNFYLQ
jgi:hypothetical protein